MTASLPVPNDIDPEEPDRHSSARVVRIADTVSPAPDKPRRPPRKGRSDGGAKGASRKPRAGADAKPQPDPGPPPPLPSDLELAASAAADIVVPPRPPLPAVESAQPADEAEAPPAPPVPSAPEPVAAEPHTPAEPVPTESETPAEPSIATEPQADPEVAPLADSAAVVDAEPVVESAPAPESAAVLEPAPAPSPDGAPAAVLEPAAVPAAEPAGTSSTAAVPDIAPGTAEPAPASSTAVVPDVASDSPAPAVTVAEPLVQPPASPAADVLVAATAPVVAAAPAAASVPVSAPPLTAASGDALVLRGVTKRFGSTHAVDGIDLTIPAGTFYGLVGPNGAGKTTTLSMIAGLLEPDRGTIHVAGVDAAAKPLAAKRLMGVLPDRLRTFDRLTGRQLLYYYGVLRKLPPAIVESRTLDLARAFDLEDALGRSVSDYSAGMLKKVMLAGAMIHSPRLLVLDEPFEAVDPVSSAIILDILSTYVAHGGTVILSSHGMDLVERVCTRVAVIVAGQVLAEGTVDEVRGELTLEQRFVELAGGLSDVEGLEWLHTFSD